MSATARVQLPSPSASAAGRCGSFPPVRSSRSSCLSLFLFPVVSAERSCAVPLSFSRSLSPVCTAAVLLSPSPLCFRIPVLLLGPAPPPVTTLDTKSCSWSLPSLSVPLADRCGGCADSAGSGFSISDSLIGWTEIFTSSPEMPLDTERSVYIC
ncbi:hypothetical protein ANANG_G00128200 [Anguilla anguilla]|uniref:Uncharacterized protein n=1 Tax=Anguilla anguilla TaxID=7936 RepID=A0A9D3MI12_ANGAN|nr:hypothetical protein ANANG_G00128200 [Anguilla anguilla]